MRGAMDMVGALRVAAGFAYVAHLFNGLQQWIGVGAVVAIGLSVMWAAQSAKGSGTDVRIEGR